MANRIGKNDWRTMKVLVLEDDDNKRSHIMAEIMSLGVSVDIDEVDNFVGYVRQVSTTIYDLIVVDLVVYHFSGDKEPTDVTTQIIDVTRDTDCPNFRSPVLALTRFNDKAEEQFVGLNRNDITILTFDEDTAHWKTAFRDKVLSCVPPVHYPFVIVCALKKEADAYAAAGYEVGETCSQSGLSCREIVIGGTVGVIVTAPRMGLVAAAITATQAISAFNTQLVCMSGICGGVKDRTRIYDVVIPDICHQNDSGKWTEAGFEPEMYSVQLANEMRLRLDALTSRPAFVETVKAGVVLRATEFPDGDDELKFKILLAPASSGSAVVAAGDTVGAVASQHRKLAAFEMESFAIYEAARLAATAPQYFSAKAVVDDGSPSKGDRFHRVACILAAKVVHGCIESWVVGGIGGARPR